MGEELSIYLVALEWLRVPPYVLPLMIAALCLLGLLLLRSSRIESIKSRSGAAAEADFCLERISEQLDSARRQNLSVVPNPEWDPHGVAPGDSVSPKGFIEPATDQHYRRLIDDLARICDAHLPEYRGTVLALEEHARNFAQARRDLLSRRDTIFRLECELVAMSAKELEDLAGEQVSRGWGDTFDDPMAVPLEKRRRTAIEASGIAEAAQRDYDWISDAVRQLRRDSQAG